MRVRLLGPVDIVVGGAARPVPGQRRKAVLAALALQPAQVVSSDLLIEVVWGDRPPATAGNTLQSHLSFLRKALGDRAAIRSRPPGYSLEISGEVTDVQAAERLVGEGTRCADPRDGAARLGAALGLWRDRPLADVTGLPWFDEHVRRLDHLRLRAEEGLMRARLALGEHTQLVPELERLCGEHPWHEELHRLLILALYRTGRQADALAAHQRLRRTLADELGIEPGPALRELHTAMLRQDPALDAPSPPATTGTTPAFPVPAQLPLALAAFSGRKDELARLDQLLPGTGAAGRASGGVAVVSAVSGTGGVGKTALAVHWAHQVQDAFPGGQLYANLRGFDPGGAVADPAEVLRGFLDALGVPPARIPAGFTAQAGLYRSLLAGRRVLVLLDNARDAEQVRPLLPGSTTCLTLVTSRNRLTSLAVTEGANLLAVDVLTPDEARDLLATRLGTRRVAAEPDAAREIVDLCAGLPLALAIVAARAAAAPAVPLAAFAAELRRPGGRLNALDAGDPVSRVREVFAWSYRGLGADAGRLFRLLGLHAGPDVGLPAVAALAGVTRESAQALVTELIRGSLLTEVSTGRYACHDLLRSYAGELAVTHDRDQDRGEAIGRLLEHYVHTAHAADTRLNRKHALFTPVPARPGAAPEDFAESGAAVRWFTAEYPVLVAAVAQAGARGFGTHAWQLASAVSTFLDRQARWETMASCHDQAREAAQRADDEAGLANAHWGLALAEAGRNRVEEARAHGELALRLFGELGNHAGQARTLQNLACLAGLEGRQEEAVEHNLRSLAHYVADADRAGQAAALNNLGWCLTELGDHHQALARCRESLALSQELGDVNGQAHTWDSLGYLHHRLGEHGEAVDCYRQAAGLFHASGDRTGEAVCLAYLGDTHHSAADPDAAHDAWTRALTLFEELGHPDTAALQAKLLDHLGADPEAQHGS